VVEGQIILSLYTICTNYWDNTQKSNAFLFLN